MRNHLKNIKIKIKKILDNRGAILVEATVAFAILLIVIGGVSAMIATGVNMNKRAKDTSDAMETAITAVENNFNDTSSLTPAEKAQTMSLSFDSGSTKVDVPVNVYKSGELYYYTYAK